MPGCAHAALVCLSTNQPCLLLLTMQNEGVFLLRQAGSAARSLTGDRQAFGKDAAQDF